ncbi:MAG: DUF3014 domain-containing protein [Thalassotalea sp.]
MSLEPLTEQPSENQVPWAVIVIIIVIVLAAAGWWMLNKSSDADVVVMPEPVAVVEEVVAEPEPLVAEPVLPASEFDADEAEAEEITPQIQLPTLDESDRLLIEKLPQITWRKELLKLVVTDDLIRRFVVFTDNFSQGNLSYDHRPFVLPTQKFYAQEVNDSETNESAWKWDESSTQRFTMYVDLLRTIDSAELVTLYFEVKPLIDQAYQELGYPEQDFTEVLQTSITRVLDMHFPQEDLKLSRQSVMYKYQDDELESLDDAEKLLLRLGKENLLVIKSILLEINDKLSRANND